MATLPDQIVSFHAMLLKLSELGLPIVVGNAASASSLERVLSDYRVELEGRIARGLNDPKKLLTETPLPDNYRQALLLWLDEPSQPRAFEYLLGPATVDEQMRWRFRADWILPILIAILGFAASLFTIRNLVPQLEQLYVRSGQTPGPIFRNLKAVDESAFTFVALFCVILLFLSAWLWRTKRHVSSGLRNQSSSSKNHRKLAVRYAKKAASIRASLWTQSPDPLTSTEPSLGSSSHPSFESESPLQKIVLEEPFALNASSIFQSTKDNLQSSTQAQRDSVAEIYTTLSRLHQIRSSKRRQPWLMLLIGGSTTAIAALSFFLPYIEFMWLVSLPEGVGQ